MLDKKDKYRLRALANPLKPIVLLGKDGFSENIVVAINQAIEKNELIKIGLLKTYSGMPVKELAEMVCDLVNANLIYIVGKTFVIYRKNKDINRYEVK